MWQEIDKKLYRQFIFKDFKAAFSFMQDVASAAESANHHPKWQNEYNKVEIWLSTHSADDSISAKDYALAKTIDDIYQKDTN